MIKFKKIISILMIAFMVLGVAQPVFAASGTGTWVGQQYESNIKTTEYEGKPYGIYLRKLRNTATGEEKTVFCAEHGVGFYSRVNYNGSFYTVTDPTMKKACKVAYFGWYQKYGDYVVGDDTVSGSKRSVMLDNVFTQQYIWEIIDNADDVFLDADVQAQYESFKNDVNNKMAEIERRPSFNNTTIDIKAGETKVIQDTNGELSKYNSIDASKDGIRFTHNKGENTMTLSVDENANVERCRISDDTFKSWGLIKEGSEDLDTNVFFEFDDGIQNQLYALNYNDPVALNFSVNVELYGKLELSKENANKDLIDGSAFNVSGDNYNQNVEVVNGKITIDKLRKGTYTIKEVSAPRGYVINTNSYKVDIKANQTTTQAIENTEPTGEIAFSKTDKYTGNNTRINGTVHHGDATLNGAIYTLYAKNDTYNVAKTIKYFSANDKIAEFKFNDAGNANITITADTTSAKLTTSGNTIKGLPIGSYYAIETTTPNGYIDDKNVYDFNLEYKDMNTSVISLKRTAEEEVKKAKFEVIKISSNDNTTANKVADAEFTAILSKYVEHYGSFEEAQKHLNDFADDEYSVFRTNENGHGVSNFLAYGQYQVRETYTPSDRIEPVEDFYINIDKNSDGVIKEFVENDIPFESYIKMIKKDKKTGKIVTLTNTSFSLYKLNEETNEYERVSCKVGNKKVDTWTTDKTGVAYTEDKLPAGTYKVDEVKLPEGFLKLEEPVIFEISLSNKTLEFDKELDPYISVTIKNEQPTGTIILDKKVELKKDADKSFVDMTDLSKIKFKLYAKEDIIDKADGSKIYAKGKEIGTYNLTKAGKLEVKNLPMGVYEVQEVETLAGLVLDNTKYEVKLEKKDDVKKVYSVTKEIKNETTFVEISKTDITGDKELTGAKLSVIDENNEVVDTWTSTDKTHKIEGLLVGKTYTLREDLAPIGYVKSTDIKFTIDNTSKVQKVTMIDKIVTMTKEDIGEKEIEGAKIQVLDKDNNVVDEWISEKTAHNIKGLVENEEYTMHEEVAVEGYVKATDVKFKVTTDKETQHEVLVDKIVQIKKTDLVTGEEIEGAELTVTDEEGNVVDEWTSTKTPHNVNGLEEGKKYTLTEVTCPYGYKQAESITFEVSKDKETQKIEMKDAPILKNVKVQKIDTETKEVIKEKFVFGIYKDSECKDLIQEIKSNKEDGFVEFKDLRYGTYYIKEVSAPNGYELSNRIVKVEINDKGIFVDDTQLEENEDTITFDFENKKIETPKTGDSSPIKLVLGVMILAFLGLALVIIKFFKDKKN